MSAAAVTPIRRIGPFTAPAVGLGCMNLSHAYGAPPAPEVGDRLLLEALELGVTLFDTAALYGFGANESLVGRVLKAYRSRIVLCSKGGMSGQPVGAGGALQRVIDDAVPRRPRQVLPAVRQVAKVVGVELEVAVFEEELSVSLERLESILRSISFIGPAMNAERFAAFRRRIHGLPGEPAWARRMTLFTGRRPARSR